MKLKLMLGILAAPLLLSACAKTDKQVIIASCEKADENASSGFCSCSYEQMEAVLSPVIIEAIAENIRNGAETTQEAISQLPQAQQIATLPVVPMLLNCIGAEE
ncbi:MAG: hypothetical protein CMK07_11615 [Ponticaulis sp.]|nr:hypothetical protein [Ponticaulis sp.]